MHIQNADQAVVQIAEEALVKQKPIPIGNQRRRKRSRCSYRFPNMMESLKGLVVS